MAFLSSLFYGLLNEFRVQNGTNYWGVPRESTAPHASVCEVGTVGKVYDCQPEGPGFNPRPGRGLNFGRPSFATPSVDRDVKPLV